jgi:hypothetical protein
MRTLRRYSNFPNAALAKTLLENYEVFCRFVDENVHCLGYYLVMPVRLTVADRQLKRAARVLAYAEKSPIPDDDVAPAEDTAPALVLDEDIFGDDDTEELEERSESNNPWEILAIAYLFLIPGVGFLLEHRRLLLWTGRRRSGWLMLSPFELHLVGGALICVAALLTVAYFSARNAIARDDSANIPGPPQASDL